MMGFWARWCYLSILCLKSSEPNRKDREWGRSRSIPKWLFFSFVRSFGRKVFHLGELKINNFVSLNMFQVKWWNDDVNDVLALCTWADALFVHDTRLYLVFGAKAMPPFAAVFVCVRYGTHNFGFYPGFNIWMNCLCNFRCAQEPSSFKPL
jgi:hypothetical protein